MEGLSEYIRVRVMHDQGGWFAYYSIPLHEKHIGRLVEQEKGAVLSLLLDGNAVEVGDFTFWPLRLGEQLGQIPQVRSYIKLRG